MIIDQGFDLYLYIISIKIAFIFMSSKNFVTVKDFSSGAR